ncbi:hypothetical protein SAMN04489806_1412 [Paramicrobacterium humi]|uniref:phosphomannomutase n=1 Tax=Paramicrobacterium humi TaxID=640635 RepID=A0A1H4L3J2_9MICO|nr:HAD-IIB family hydrolase [Microbacterium humi]SEB65330.1 hypothetical protein SAMN04489806_1412 [Microbacterium humi]
MSDGPSTPLLVAFDLDDTLAASKSPMSPEMAERLRRLLDAAEVAVISGGQFAQFQAQLVDRLGDTTPQLLERLHLLPTCGTQYFRFRDAEWHRVYAQELSDEQKSAALAALESSARGLGLWEERTWGPILEDRGSQITFSALGQSAPVDAKVAWDPDGSKRLRLRDAVAATLPDLEVRAGGTTSIDITRPGIDKAYGMRQLAEQSGIRLDDMLFVGDRLDEHGNDYPVKQLGVRCIEVTGPDDTLGVIDGVLSGVLA